MDLSEEGDRCRHMVHVCSSMEPHVRLNTQLQMTSALLIWWKYLQVNMEDLHRSLGDKYLKIYAQVQRNMEKENVVTIRGYVREFKRKREKDNEGVT